MKTYNLTQIEDRHQTLDLAKGELWHALRKNLSPVFTSGKLKAMMEPIAALADNIVNPR